MRAPILCRPRSNGDDPWEWVVLGDDGASAQSGHGDFDRLAPLCEEHDLVLLADSTLVSMFEVEVPARNAALVARALPYAIEDELAEEPEQLAIGVGPAVARHTYPIAVIAKSRLTEYTAAADAREIALAAVVPDVFGVPWRVGEIGVCLEGDTALVRTGEYAGYKTITRELHRFLALTELDESTDVARKVTVYCTRQQDDDARRLAATIEGATVEPLRDGMSALAFLAANVHAGGAIDLLTSDPSRKAARRSPLQMLAVAAAIAALAFAVHLGYRYSAIVQIERAADAADAEARALFGTMFPDVRRIVDVRFQAQQKLAELGESDPTALALLPTIYRIGSVLDQLNAPGLRFTAISYTPDYLLVTLSAKAIKDVEAYQQNLELVDLNVSLVSAETRRDDIMARIRVSNL